MRGADGLPGPVYVEAEPRQGLDGIVRRLWRYEAPGDPQKIERIPPDGCAELIIHLGAPYREIQPGGGPREQPTVLFAGQLTMPLAIAAAGAVETIGVRFEPEAAKRFFGAPMQAATDRRIDLSTFLPEAATFRQALAKAKSGERFALAEDFVERRIAHAGVPGDAIVSAAVRTLEADEAGDLRSGLSERHFQRRFLDCVGVSARMLQSIFRFRRVFDAIERPETHDWVAAALAAGYFDQPQMARDFRRFLGCTASDWARQKTGLASLLAADSYKLLRGGPE